MSAIDHLRAIGRGETPPDDGLLGNARCGWGGDELIGEESILAAFCAIPFEEHEAIAIEAVQGAALVGESDALFADVYHGRVGRLWRVGGSIAQPPERAIDIAFDPDMSQRRGDVFFRAADHPELDSAASERLMEAAKRYVDEKRRTGALRMRAFVLRAFGGADGVAGLLAVYAMDNASSRSVSFSYCVIRIDRDGDVRVVSDAPPPRAWSPRF